ncbi:acyltransferase family protein [Shewanella sp. 0m-8]
MSKKKEPLASYRQPLNVLRGFAAFYVVFYHLRYFSTYDWFGEVPFIQFGYIGVDFFFILSGLIISHVYLKRSVNEERGFWLKFIWYRIARLFPIHFFIMLLMLIVTLLLPAFDANRQAITHSAFVDWITLTLLLRQWLLPEGYAWNTPAWSVSAEFFAYLIIFPFIVRFSAKNVTAKTGCVLMAIGSGLIGMLIVSAGTTNATSFAGPLVRVSGGFFIGSGLYYIISSIQAERNWDRFLGYSILLTIISFILAPHLQTEGVRADILLIFSFILLIASAYQAKGILSRFMSRPRLFWFGEISFSLYLCHIPVMMLCKFVAEYFQFDRGLNFSFICLVLAICSAHILYKFVEIPCRNRMRFIYQK